jgi:hypothetical protein
MKEHGSMSEVGKPRKQPSLYGEQANQHGAGHGGDMTVDDDPFAALGDGGPRVREPARGWRSENGRAGFWIVAGIGVLVLCAAWFMYGLAGLNEMTDMEPPSGPVTTTLLYLGVIPIVFVHALLLLVLILIGAMSHTRRAIGVLLAVSAVAVASIVGIVLNQLLTEGCLFAMSAYQMCPAYVP